ncbi:MAG: hypothetical protein GY751_25045, partial [Bacteroidetes bacterium]|nr:hypothetical protein [Bacteroidota bacterium]
MKKLMSAFILVFLLTSSVYAAENVYVASPETSTNGGGTWGPILSMGCIINGNNGIFRITKQDGSTFSSSGTLYLKVATYESYATNNDKITITAGMSSADLHTCFEHNSPKVFYARFESNEGGSAWVGPITIETESGWSVEYLTQIYYRNWTTACLPTSGAMVINYFFSTKFKEVDGEWVESDAIQNSYRTNGQRLYAKGVMLDNRFESDLESYLKNWPKNGISQYYGDWTDSWGPRHNEICYAYDNGHNGYDREDTTLTSQDTDDLVTQGSSRPLKRILEERYNLYTELMDNSEENENLSEANLSEAVERGPVIVSTNIFHTFGAGHIIVITGKTQDGRFIAKDPWGNNNIDQDPSDDGDRVLYTYEHMRCNGRWAILVPIEENTNQNHERYDTNGGFSPYNLICESDLHFNYDFNGTINSAYDGDGEHIFYNGFSHGLNYDNDPTDWFYNYELATGAGAFPFCKTSGSTLVTNRAEWKMRVTKTGDYHIEAGFFASSDNATNVPYEIYINNALQPPVVVIDQTTNSAGTGRFGWTTLVEKLSLDEGAVLKVGVKNNVYPKDRDINADIIRGTLIDGNDDNDEIIYSSSGLIRQGEKIVELVTLTSSNITKFLLETENANRTSRSKADRTNRRAGNNVDLIITMPNGQTLEPASEAVLDYYESETQVYYIIDCKEQGAWKVDIVGADVASSGELYEFKVLLSEDFIPDSKPDLIVEDPGVKPYQTEPGDTVQLRVRVRNIGKTPADAFKITCYLSVNGNSLDSDDILLHQSDITSLNPDSTNILEPYAVIPSNIQSGDFHLIFCADHDEDIQEANESNNTSVIPIKIGISTPADITVENPSVTPTQEVIPGQSVTLSASVINVGGTGTVAASGLGYYLSANGNTWDNSDILLGTSYFGLLLPEENKLISRELPLPGKIPSADRYYIVFYADYPKNVDETDENNNQAAREINISYSKAMTVFTPKPGTSWAMGKPHTITWTSNLGGTVKIELLKSLTVDRLIENAAPNSVEGEYTWTFPNDLFPASHYKIRITSNSNPTVFDESEPFEITYGENITVLSPANSDNWGRGTTRNITWKSDFRGAVDIDLYKGGTLFQPIDRSIETSSAYDSMIYPWVIPSDMPEASDYQIRITKTSDSTTSDSSEGLFTISEPDISQPITVEDAVSTEKNVPVSIPVLANDNPPSNETLQIASITQGQNGSVAMNSGSTSVTYTPNSSFTGMDFFTYTVNTVSNGASTGTVYVTVVDTSGPNQPWIVEIQSGGQIAADSSGNVFKVAGFGDRMIEKYNANGELQWSQKATVTHYNNHIGGIAVDHAGNAYITGYFGETITLFEGNTPVQTLGESTANSTEIFIAKYNPFGKLAWTQVAGGKWGDYGEAIVVDNNSGHFYIAGSFDEVITFGSGASSTTLNSDSLDMFIAKYTLDGKSVWAKQITGGSGSIQSLAVDVSGNIIATGHFENSAVFPTSARSTPTTLTGSGGGDNFFIAKFSNSGNVIWAQKATSGLSVKGWDICTDSAGTIYTVGSFERDATFFNGNSNIASLTGKQSSTDIFIAKYSSDNGNPEWVRQAGGVSDDYSYDIGLDETEKPVIIGRFSGSIEFTAGSEIALLNAADTSSTFVAKYDRNGNLVGLGSPTGAVSGHDIVFDSLGNAHLIGSFSGTITFGADDSSMELINSGTGNGFLAKLDGLEPLIIGEAVVTSDDVDNDGVKNDQDVFPYDPNEWEDTDNDGIGENADFDDDNDGMPDSWETANGLDPKSPADALSDNDGDGLSNRTEYEWGTDPNIADPMASVRIIAIAAGIEHVLALAEDGTVWAWGKNNDGQIGNGSNENQLVPVQIQGLTGITSLSAGESHALALKQDGTVWAWGYNRDGELGNNLQTNSNIPVKVHGLTNAIAISAGSYHSVALKADGTVWTWGMNSSYQLGYGPGGSVDELVPGQVANLNGVNDIAGGYNFTMILKQDKTAWAWGANQRGQLGTGNTNNRSIPTRIQLSGIVKAIETAYSSRAFAVMNDGTMRGWGYNGGYGAIGNGNGWDQATPVQVKGSGGSGYLNGVIAAASGWEHSIALKSDGSIWAWGRNSEGEYGNGTTSYSTTPVQGPNLTGTVAIAAGQTFNIALKNDGTVWTWGSNYSGQLGNGTTEGSLTPSQVLFTQDADGDGVPDSLDSFPNDPDEWKDTDNDGTGNNADTDDDEDGMPDAFELSNGFKPLDASDANADTDNDGYTNLEEYLGNTNPNDASDPGNLILAVTPSVQTVPSVTGTRYFTVSNTGTGAMNWTATVGLSWLEIISGNTGENSGEIIIGFEANSGPERTGEITVEAVGAANSPQTVKIKQASDDSDSDGLKDSWEIEYFGDLSHNGTADTDGDNLTDLQEYQNATDPGKDDTDNDGMQDGWEVDNNLNPNFSSDAFEDSDQDGVTNLDEYLAGNNPWEKDYFHIMGTASYTGSLVGQLYIAAYRTTDTNYDNSVGEQVHAWDVQTENANYTLIVSDGNYYLKGFLDSNYNGNWDEGEPEGRYDTETVIIAGADDTVSRDFSIEIQSSPSGEASLSITPSFQDISATSGIATFEVSNTGTGTMEWTATTDADWISITPVSGTDNGIITASYETNFGDARTALFKITANGADNSPQTVEVRQNKASDNEEFLNLPDIQVNPGDTVTIPITAANSNNNSIQSVYAVIEIKKNMIDSVKKITSAGGIRDGEYMFEKNIVDNGDSFQIIIAFAAKTDVYTTVSGKIAEIQVHISENADVGDITPLTFAKAELNDSSVDRKDGSIEIIPETFKISGNIGYFKYKGPVPGVTLELEGDKQHTSVTDA